MRYKCENKGCIYRKRNKKFWNIHCKAIDAPVTCPYCGAKIVKWKRSEEIGSDYEDAVTEFTNKTLGIPKDKGCYRVPGSGCHKNLKGDVTRFPKPIDKLLCQCKKTKLTKDEAEQWRKTWKDAITMRQEPMLIKEIFGRHTVRLDYEYFLLLIKEFIRCANMKTS